MMQRRKALYLIWTPKRDVILTRIDNEIFKIYGKINNNESNSIISLIF